MMPLMSVWICFIMPAAMGIYWIANSVFGMIRDFTLTKIYKKQLDKEDAERQAKRSQRERELEEKGKDELLELVRGIVPAGVKCIYIRQPKALGLGHAVLCAKPVVGDEPFGVMLADDLVDAPSSCIGQLTAVREARGGGSVIAVQDVAPEATNKYGIVSVDDTSLQTSQMRGIVEKPDPKVAPSRMAVIGRYVFEPEVFDYLEKVTVGVGGEIQLTDGIASSLDTVPTYAHRFEGTRFDCGSKQGFLDATIHFARKRGFKIN